LHDLTIFYKDYKTIILDDGRIKEIYLGVDGTILIINPKDPDGGTAFNPNIQDGSATASQEYFDSQKPK
jgi:hypothetical protein